MVIREAFRGLTARQRHAFVAALAGWTLDAFDFFVMVVCVHAIAEDFHATIKDVSEGLFLTLAMRPVGALVFGALAQRYGRRPVLMINVVSFAMFELASAFAPSLTVLLVLRALFGFAMGGEWGVGAALAFESLPKTGRGVFSGILQEGYVIGYLLASALFAFGFQSLGWRGMFIVGALPALLVFYIRRNVDESPAWQARVEQRSAAERGAAAFAAVRDNAGLFVFLVVLMACFNALSHGTQDLYQSGLLQQQHHFSPHDAGLLGIVAGFGALFGGITFGTLSERLGRRRAMALAAVLALPMIPMWAYSSSRAMFALGAFLMQFMVQGAWGIVPVHLNELAPVNVRALLPGFAYQIGNFAMSRLSPIQAKLAAAHHGDYAWALSWTVAIAGVLVAAVALLGREGARATLVE